MMSGLSDGRIAIAAQAVGIAQAALEAAIHYAREREVAGKPIMELQGVSFALADMAAQVDIARQYYIHAARLLEAGLPCMKEAAIAKLFASEMAEKVCSRRCRFMADTVICGISRWSVTAAMSASARSYEGTSNIQKLIIARNL